MLNYLGTTIWAFVFSLKTINYSTIIYKAHLHNETAWILVNTDSKNYYNGFILMYDTNGSLIRTLSLILTENNIDSLGFIQLTSITSFDDQSLILGGIVVQVMSFIGYSVESFFDEALFKLDSEGNVIWCTAIDYNLGYNSDITMNVYDSIIYAGFFTNNIYLSYVAVNGTDGSLIISNSFSFPIRTTSDISSKFWFYA